MTCIVHVKESFKTPLKGVYCGVKKPFKVIVKVLIAVQSSLKIVHTARVSVKECICWTEMPLDTEITIAMPFN